MAGAMKLTQIALAILPSLLALSVSAQTVASQAYTPMSGACPSNFSLVRMAGSSADNQTLSPSESAYIQTRKSQVLPQAWKSYLANVQATKVSLPDYVTNILEGNSTQNPTLGIATSGGGYRAAIFGAGVLNALDARNGSSASAGTGGLLQAATYLSGLSGGSWFLTSLVQADFPTIQDLVFGPTSGASASNNTNAWGGWLAQYDIFAPNDNPITDVEYIKDLVEELQGKRDAGYVVTFADFWARALARHFANGTTVTNFFDESVTHGAGVLFSGVANTSSFTSHSIPFPIVIADLDSPSQNTSNVEAGDYIPLTNPLIEFNVFEMGSFDPVLSAFTPTKYLGTQNTSVCVTGYDQSSFVAGSSSELFNEYNLTNILNATLGSVISVFESLLPQEGVELDVASWPNAFYGVSPDTFIDSNQKNLNLVDGGEDGEVIPIQPLLVKTRDVDVIVAIDATSDVNNFADGSSLIATQNRTTFFPSAYSFPPVPNTLSEFTAQNLSTRPTFFGCNTSTTAPLVIYLANGGPPHNGEAPLTNTSTAQISYQAAQIQAMLDQTFLITTQGYPANSSEAEDPEWPACLACAVVDRARNRTGVDRSGVCASCFERYCWDGDVTTGAPSSTSKASRVNVVMPVLGAVLASAFAVSAM
ncbi:hypothetical protein SERLA73DRAFT_104762 [Serpula lacrymans var. lacrymans S7.3]|uniref:Lysophospholipase n=2 Tax=Serpula lacrymans var. lacrymans TaxID=341189 RepID=F8PR54_SERL3|nr:uncharacterized protein SERLADRAFT_360527 [Serpula lacrymans var. lacrymans S7.9]EGO02345.1 hypothetical protein SERLA73DRAFT_104762 [Serpula lacrymans var. lacrymans S7.3]EGO28079.1 hypothetical protein SERLADRAFT_360527 [Serpula lacrymans var. lacrymans S7.9]